MNRDIHVSLKVPKLEVLPARATPGKLNEIVKNNKNSIKLMTKWKKGVAAMERYALKRDERIISTIEVV